MRRNLSVLGRSMSSGQPSIVTFVGKYDPSCQAIEDTYAGNSWMSDFAVVAFIVLE